MGGEESDERCLRVEAEGVVVEIDRVELREVEDGSEEVREGFGDLGQQPTCEDVGEVGDLNLLSAPGVMMVRAVGALRRGHFSPSGSSW